MLTAETVKKDTHRKLMPHKLAPELQQPVHEKLMGTIRGNRQGYRPLPENLGRIQRIGRAGLGGFLSSIDSMESGNTLGTAV
jgi:hypothetical protein